MKNLLVLTTGGTIDKVYFDAISQYEVGEPAVSSILSSMNLAYDFEVVSICRKDSLEMNSDDREALKAAIASTSKTHILITHGTDTMVETAKFLGSVPDKMIVLCGSMQPAIFKETDGIFNIGTALGVLSCAKPGIYIAMNGRVFNPEKVFKNYDTGRFTETH